MIAEKHKVFFSFCLLHEKVFLMLALHHRSKSLMLLAPIGPIPNVAHLVQTPNDAPLG